MLNQGAIGALDSHANQGWQTTMLNTPSYQPDRYNRLGEWKPLFCTNDLDAINSKVSLLSNDLDVQGTLLYIFVTDKRVLEFVVRTTLQLPVDHFSFGNDFHLWLCPSAQIGATYEGRNVNIYDGWHNLQAPDPNEIDQTIHNINRIMNRLAFAFGATVDWRVKYSKVNHTVASVKPSHEDLDILRTILSDSSDSIQDVILDAAIDWYNRGTTSRNPFTAFLCFYIALESIVIAITSGETRFGLDHTLPTNPEQREVRNECIKSLHDSLYQENPAQFVRDAYFDCVVPLAKRTRQVMELVFGSEHSYFKLLFDKNDGQSLADIRSEIAHGRITAANKEDEKLIKSRLPEMDKISHEFLNRIIALSRSTPINNIPGWSGLFSLEMDFTDPRVDLITSDNQAIERHDWKIKPEWCD